jgi:Heparinase II/III-like protein
MNQSRRAFLQTASLAALALPVGRLAAASPQEPAPPGKRRGLLFDREDLPRIRANAAHPRFASYWKGLVSADLADDTDFLLHHVRRNNHTADMLRVRTILERAGFVYVVTGEKRQLDIARLAIQRILDYPKWDVFLEGGRKPFGLQRAPEATIALAFALDWYGEELDPGVVAEIERQIAEKGAPACYTTLYGLKYPDRVEGWGMDPDEDYPYRNTSLKRWPLIINATNLKVIPIAGLGVAACLLHGRHPQAEAWLDLARSSAKAFSTMYGEDGSYGEGVSYWVYTTLHMALFAEVLWRTRGIDDRRLLNYPGTARYGLAMTLPRLGEIANPNQKQENMGVPLALIHPRHDIVNFGDANGSVDSSVASWAGRTFDDPVCRWIAREASEAKTHYGVIWYEPAAPSAPPEPELKDDRMTNDLVVSRSGWGPADGVVALRSGGPGNHEHADRNSVIFKAHGDRLLNDHFRAGYSNLIERWKLRLTSAHTAVLVDGKGHQYHHGEEGTNASLAFARVTAFATGPGWMTVTSDATDAYQMVNPNVARVERTLVFLKPDILLILDRVAGAGHPVGIQARFQVYNDDSRGTCSASAGAFAIDRPFATLRAGVASAHPARVECGTLPLPAKEGLFPFVEASAGPALSHELLTACTAAPAGEAHGTIALSREGAGWRARGSHRGQAVNVLLGTGGEGPPSVSL